MREIKFRAWDKEMEEMHNVDRIQFDVDEIDVTVKKTEGYEEFYAIPFQEIKLMQYTGLKDKNGKEIYEGDIVEFIDCECEMETLCVGEAIFEEFGWHLTNSITESSLNCYDSQDIKVIGNIYENKELLEVK